MALAQAGRDLDPRALDGKTGKGGDTDFQKLVFTTIARDLKGANQNDLPKAPPPVKVAGYVVANAEGLGGKNQR